MKKVLVFGGSGLIGSRFVDLHKKTFDIKAPLTGEVDILNSDQILRAIDRFNPDAVVNFAAYTNVEEGENQKNDRDGICFQINTNGAKNVAEACKKFDKYLIHISTEYVFDGKKTEGPYVEDDRPNPVNWYGETKYFAEGFVLESDSRHSIARLSMPYSSHYELKKDVARFFLEQLRQSNPVKAIEDQRITPTFVDDIVIALRVLIDNTASGIYHISSKDSTTPLDFVKTIAEVFKLNYQLITPITYEDYNKNKKAKLLQNSWLNPAKFEKQFGEDILHIFAEGLLLFKKQIEELTD